jgi:peptidoglycan/LPS O-acetylase OafA/YrhL
MTGKSHFSSSNANLDLVRAVAVLSVFFAHLSGILWRHSEAGWLLGQMGVLIFFVHTSMVLMLSLERSTASGRRLITDFYVRRLFRIYPLAIVCVTIAFVFGSWTWRDYVSNVTLTQNLLYLPDMVRGLWSLPLEVQMYIVLPFMFLAFRDRAIRWVMLAWVAAVVLGFVQAGISARLNVVGFAPCFIGGVLAWRLSRRYAPSLDGRWWPVAFVLSWVVWAGATRELHMYFRWSFCLVLGLAIPWFREIPWQPVQRAARTIATYSYGIYLSHFAIMQFSFETLRGQPAPLRWAVFIALATLVPVALFHLVERPMMSVGRKVAERSHREPAPAAAPFTVSALG